MSSRGTTLTTPEKLILGAAAVLLVAGAVLAVAQPGDLGDDAETAGETTTTTTTLGDPTTTTTTTTVEEDPTGTTGIGGDSGTTPGPTAPGGTTPPGPPSEATTTTVAGSGISGGGTPSGGAPELADTGHEALLGAGIALAALGLALRRLHLASWAGPATASRQRPATPRARAGTS